MTTPQDKPSFAEWLNIRRDQSVSEAFHDICIAVAEEVKSALLQAQPAEAGRVPLTEEKTDMLHWFTARRVDNAGGTPGYTLYKVKMGAHPEYQLYRNEAYALWRNLGDALGILSKEK